jgi:hypothetical protein
MRRGAQDQRRVAACGAGGAEAPGAWSPRAVTLQLTGALLVLLAAASGADEGGRLHIATPVFDFGTVERGTKVEHVFGLRNQGPGELRIEQVKSSCGCTVAVVSAAEVAAGGEGRVAVTLDTARMAGRVTKVVTVYSSDPQAPVRTLTLAGEVVADLVLAPTPLYLGRLRRGAASRHEVVITPGRPAASWAVTAVEHTSPALRTRLEPRPEGVGQRLIVELDPAVPLGRFNEQLRLRTTSPREPLITLPVFGSVEGDVAVLPPQVTFGVALGRVAEREVFIRNRGLRPLAVTRVAVPDRLVSYELDTVHAGVEYRLTLRLREGIPPGKVEGTIDIFTDHPDEGHLVVPVYAIVPRAGRRG